MVKVGIIGCGKIAQVRHIPEYLDNPNAKLTGLYDLKIRKLMQSVYVWQIMYMPRLRLLH